MNGQKRLINLTPHAIQIWHGDKCVLEIKPEKHPVRCKEQYDFLENINGIEVGIVEYLTPDLPPPQKDTYYIVSVLVAQQFKYRNDLLMPYDLVRNEKGSILGCRKLVKII